MHGIVCYMSLCDGLLSLSTVLSASTHLAAASELCSVLRLQNISVCGCTAHPSTDTAAPTVWPVESSAVDVGVYMSVRVLPSALWGDHPEVGLGAAGSRGQFTFNV